jgi:hypothetical protein
MKINLCQAEQNQVALGIAVAMLYLRRQSIAANSPTRRGTPKNSVKSTENTINCSFMP